MAFDEMYDEYERRRAKALAMGVLGLHWFDSHKEELDVQLELPPVEAGKVHRADYDAWYQAHILLGLLRQIDGLKAHTGPVQAYTRVPAHTHAIPCAVPH